MFISYRLTFTFSSIFLAGWDGGGGASGSKLTRCPIPRRKALPPEFQPLLVLVSILKARSSSGAPISSPRPLSPGDPAPLAPCSSSLCALSETDTRRFPSSFLYIYSRLSFPTNLTTFEYSILTIRGRITLDLSFTQTNEFERFPSCSGRRGEGSGIFRAVSSPTFAQRHIGGNTNKGLG